MDDRVPRRQFLLGSAALMAACGGGEGEGSSVGDPTHSPDELLRALRRHHEGPLPGELEAAVLGAAGDLACESQPCTLLMLPEPAADALCRDRVAGPLLRRRLDARTCVVLAADLGVVRDRLEWLGFEIHAGGRPERTDDPDTAPTGYANA